MIGLLGYRGVVNMYVYISLNTKDLRCLFNQIRRFSVLTGA